MLITLVNNSRFNTNAIPQQLQSNALLQFGQRQSKLDSKIAQRVSLVTPSMIRAVSRLAEKYPGTVNLGQGTPADDPPKVLIQAAKAALDNGHNQYTNVWGIPEFRQAIAKKYSPKLGFAINPEEHVTVTCGVTEAVFSALYALINKGDEVVMFEPRYDNYLPAVVWNGGKTKYVPLLPPTDKTPRWQLDAQKLEAAITPKTKVILLNSPHNPSGKVFTKQDLEQIAAVCKKHDLIAITDEVYEHLLFDHKKHISLATIPGMKERTITVSGLSKAYDATGWRVAWTVAPKVLTDAIKKTHDFITLCAPGPFQQAGIQAMAMPGSYYQAYRNKYAERRDVLKSALDKAGLKTLPIEGAYYLMADATALCKKLGLKNDIELTDFLIKKIGVAGVPGSNFMTPNPQDARIFIRFSFCKKIETLKEAGQKLLQLQKLVQQGYKATASDLKGPGILDML